MGVPNCVMTKEESNSHGSSVVKSKHFLGTLGKVINGENNVFMALRGGESSINEFHPPLVEAIDSDDGVKRGWRILGFAR